MNRLSVAIAILVMTFGASAMNAGADAKVTLCHKGRTLDVPQPAVSGHVGHGDTLGQCTVSPSR